VPVFSPEQIKIGEEMAEEILKNTKKALLMKTGTPQCSFCYKFVSVDWKHACRQHKLRCVSCKRFVKDGTHCVGCAPLLAVEAVSNPDTGPRYAYGNIWADLVFLGRFDQYDLYGNKEVVLIRWGDKYSDFWVAPVLDALCEAMRLHKLKDWSGVK